MMHQIIAPSVDHALSAGLDLLEHDGDHEMSRAGPVLVAPSPVVTTWLPHVSRVSLSRVRDANPFFHLYEAMWMLSGGRYPQQLDEFVRDFSSRFAEPSGEQHGAYGHRWREAFGIDQLDHCVEMLRREPTSRQAVIQMWDAGAHDDLTGSWRDRPCLSGDTVVWSPEGDRTLTELRAMFLSGLVTRWPIYAACGGRSDIAWMTDVWSSGTKDTVKLTFDDGSHIVCTPDHLFYQYHGSGGNVRQISASKLRPGDRVQARTRRVNRHGYEVSCGLLTSWRYAEKLMGVRPSGHVLHHKNGDKRDNRASNLTYWPKSDHDRHHHLGDYNPMRLMSLQDRAAKGATHSATMRKFWESATDQFKLIHGQRTAAGISVDGRERQRMAVTGRRHTTEALAAMSASRKEYWRRRRENHVVVSVEPHGRQEVFDFSVPDWHTAVVGTGVVTHNCNTHAYLRRRDGALDLTVCCRSNDLLWGTCGSNVVHFSFLHEYLAAQIGVGRGFYYQVSNNFHAYVTAVERLRSRGPLDLPQGPLPGSRPLVDDPETFDGELNWVMARINCSGEPPADLRNPFLTETFHRAILAFRAYRARATRSDVLDQASLIQAPDWRAACMRWLERGMDKWR